MWFCIILYFHRTDILFWRFWNLFWFFILEFFRFYNIRLNWWCSYIHLKIITFMIFWKFKLLFTTHELWTWYKTFHYILSFLWHFLWYFTFNPNWYRRLCYILSKIKWFFSNIFWAWFKSFHNFLTFFR